MAQQHKDPLIPTRASLIRRLKDWQDQSSWEDFFQIYWKLIYGVARKADLTLIGRAKGKRFVALAGEHRLIFDADPGTVAEEAARHGRKGARSDDGE